MGVGTQQVDQAGRTIAELVASVKRVSEAMGDITAASREQEAGISQVNQAVMQMDQVTQHNAALVEEAAAAPVPAAKAAVRPAPPRLAHAKATTTRGREEEWTEF